MSPTLTEESFRALARSSPWRWRSVHLTWHDALAPWVEGDAQAWLRRPDLLRVEHAGEVQVVRHESPAIMEFTTDERSPGRPVLRPRPWDIEPGRDEQGLVTQRPDRFTVDYDDPMYQSYTWVALLDPVELADGEGGTTGVTLSEMRETQRRGRRTWWARAVPSQAYDPRCSCCPLLWGEVSEQIETEGGGPASESGEYPEAYEVALDVQTGICVAATPVGAAPPFAGHDVSIHAVDEDYPDELFEEPSRLARSVGVARSQITELRDRVRGGLGTVDG